jgi:acyl transferase domain-containing protein
MEAAIRIAFCRGFAASAVNQKGAMAAIGFGRDAVEPYLMPGVVIACENSGCSVTISGDEDKIQTIIKNIKLHNPNVLARRLNVEIAYHSRKSHYYEVHNSL